jgi:hypothetical protein
VLRGQVVPLKHVSLFRYSMEALAVTQLDGFKFDCQNAEGMCGFNMKWPTCDTYTYVPAVGHLFSPASGVRPTQRDILIRISCVHRQASA